MLLSNTGEDIASLPPAVLVDLKQQLESNLEEILFSFAGYTDCVQVSLEKRNVTVKRLCAYLLGLPAFTSACSSPKLSLLASKKDKLEVASCISDIMIILKTECTSFLNYQIFESLIKNFKLDEGQELLKYPTKLLKYIEMHKVSEFIEIQPVLSDLSDDSKELILVFDFEPTCRLSGLFDLGKAVAKIMGLKQSVLRIHNIKENCVVVTYLIPTLVAESIFISDEIFSEAQKEEFRALSVQRLECNMRTFTFLVASPEHEMNDTDMTIQGNYLRLYYYTLCSISVGRSKPLQKLIYNCSLS